MTVTVTVTASMACLSGPMCTVVSLHFLAIGLSHPCETCSAILCEQYSECPEMALTPTCTSTALFFAKVLRCTLTTCVHGQAVEHWNIEPGDGCVYYTVRPPWVAQDKTETFFMLHPEERSLETLLAYREANTEQRKANERTLHKDRNWRGVVR